MKEDNEVTKENANQDSTFSPMKIHKKQKRNKINVLKEVKIDKQEDEITYINPKELDELFGKLSDAPEPKKDFREL